MILLATGHHNYYNIVDNKREKGRPRETNNKGGG